MFQCIVGSAEKHLVSSQISDIISLKFFVEKDISDTLIYILKIEHNDCELGLYVDDYLLRKGYTYKNIFDRIKEIF